AMDPEQLAVYVSNDLSQILQRRLHGLQLDIWVELLSALAQTPRVVAGQNQRTGRACENRRYQCALAVALGGCPEQRISRRGCNRSGLNRDSETAYFRCTHGQPPFAVTARVICRARSGFCASRGWVAEELQHYQQHDGEHERNDREGYR